MTKTSSAALKASTVAAAALSIAPATASAGLVYVIDRPVTVSFDALGGSIGSAGVGWDIDGVNGTDTHFSVNRVAYRTFTDSDGNVVQDVHGSLNFPGLYGSGPVVFAREGGRSHLVTVYESTVVGPRIYNSSRWQPPPFNGIETRASIVTPPGGTPRTYFQIAEFSETQYGSSFGVRLMPFGFDISGQQHIGWARIRFEDAPDVQLVIERWAYESEPNTPVHVNNIPAPPASVAALSLLAMGAAGVRSWRKRQVASSREQSLTDIL